ncbi:GNAT family N-acetyltransferase [Saccharibacillus alkalitolerans]|uniref:GNAT family N-acetyltransferase n=1 Tax=Saccharibacillus alkalitolerans TaxID=2705290 RepID=A0ABX0F3A3_9BACL|nr:GNAT family N-acetyltransferase [Saccharibacillus alkalitolerans]NGZ74960.1 GNAT family N-acetyltransferase [Saccharibacillus alkalitolerans]
METIKIGSAEELEQAFLIRKTVFVEEQGVPLEDEFDEFDRPDAACEHVLVFYEGRAVGTGRIRVVQGTGKLERICILEPYRKHGIGRRILEALERIAAEKGLVGVKLHGQSQARGFYEKLGYAAASDEFMEDGIPHLLMVKALRDSASEQTSCS